MLFQNIRISIILNILTGLIFIIACVLFLFLLKHNIQKLALDEAESKARLILDRNLAIHHYYSYILKPKLFEWSESFRTEDYFEPIWMSSTYAVRIIDGYFKEINRTDYYYKECAINARSPENEADAYERFFLEELQKDAELTERSDIRQFGGIPYFVFLRRGEVLEDSCLRCHSTPDRAPTDLVRQYGSERSFYRSVGGVVSAISIRVPLSSAYHNANRLTYYLFFSFLLLLIAIFLIHSFLYRGLVFQPIHRIREKARQIASDRTQLGDTIPISNIHELRDLTVAFNEMALSLRENMNSLERRVERRTSALTQANEDLQNEIVERHKIEMEREKLIEELRDALTQVKVLKGFLPICCSCKKIRDDRGYWNKIETYISERSEAEFSHGFCPECAKRMYPDYYNDEESGEPPLDS